jgi:hypothetical protein
MQGAQKLILSPCESFLSIFTTTYHHKKFWRNL